MNQDDIREDHLNIARRKLPHWQIGGSWYFLTFRTKNNLHLSDAARDCIAKTLRDENKKTYTLAVATIMPDHVHIIFRPIRKSDRYYHSLSNILRDIKGRSSRIIGKMTGLKNTLWQTESFDRIIRDDEEWKNKHEYIRNNSVKAGLVEKPEDYKWLIVYPVCW